MYISIQHYRGACLFIAADDCRQAGLVVASFVVAHHVAALLSGVAVPAFVGVAGVPAAVAGFQPVVVTFAFLAGAFGRDAGAPDRVAVV
jgi:hypothetical protein